jgi:tetrahydromethanopterin S-methyltransferase subunit E
MVTKKINTHRKVNKVVEAEPQSSKNLMGLGGFAMIILTNYQAEIKQSLSILLGFLK